MNKFLSKFDLPSKKILFASLVMVLYMIAAALPFLAAHQPPNEASGNWSYTLAPIHYGLIFFPIYILFCIIIGRNFLKAETCRRIIYTTAFCTFFAASHMVFFMYGMVILWFGILTIPLGLLGLYGIYKLASDLDKKDESQKEQTEDDMELSDKIPETDNIDDTEETEVEPKKKLSKTEIAQIIINIAIYCFIPAFLICILYKNYEYITVIKPRENARIKQEAVTRCNNYKKAIQLTTKKYSLTYPNSFEELVDEYKQEFIDYKFQFKPFIGNYNTVNTRIGAYYTEFSFEGKNKDGNMVYATFIFTKEGECSRNSQNCRWDSFPNKCTFYMSEDGTLYYPDELN